MAIPHTATERLLFALRFGHHWNPAYPHLAALDEGRVRKMTGSEQDASDLLASYQALDANVARLVAALHGRELEPDGIAGPATDTTMGFARCALPDYAPPPGASFDYGIEDLNAAVRSYQEWAEAAGEQYTGGSGSWPKGCDPDRKDVHSVRVSVLSAGASATQKGYLRDALALVEKCEAEMGQAVRHIIDGDPKQAEHDVRFEYIAGGVIGYNYFPKPNTCQQVVTGRLDNSYNPGVVTFANLCVHEYKGHGDGLQHTNGGIMNPSIVTINPLSWKGDKHESTKRRYFGGVAVPPASPPPTDPPTTPPGGKLILRGTLEAVLDGKVIGKFSATPAAEV